MGNCREAYKDKRADGMPLRSTILMIVEAKQEDIVQRRSMQVRKRIGIRAKDKIERKIAATLLQPVYHPNNLFCTYLGQS